MRNHLPSLHCQPLQSTMLYLQYAGICLHECCPCTLQTWQEASKQEGMSWSAGHASAPPPDLMSP